MPDKNRSDQPRTAGELRRLIEEKGYKWIVDPRLRDNDPLPKYQRGGDGSVSPLATFVDVSDFLRQHPPSNPFLRARWIELGLLPADNRGVRRGSPSNITSPNRKT